MKQCSLCGSQDRYYAKGLCKLCYSKRFWAEHYSGNERIKQMAAEKSKRSYEKHKQELSIKRKARRQEDLEGVREYFREAQKKYRSRLKERGTDDNELYLYGGMKKQVYSRDRYSCVDCGITQYEYTKLGHGKLHIHHIDGTGWGKSSKDKNNDINNLVTLCNKCHSRETQRILHGHKPRTLEEFKN